MRMLEKNQNFRIKLEEFQNLFSFDTRTQEIENLKNEIAELNSINSSFQQKLFEAEQKIFEQNNKIKEQEDFIQKLQNENKILKAQLLEANQIKNFTSTRPEKDNIDFSKSTFKEFPYSPNSVDGILAALKDQISLKAINFFPPFPPQNILKWDNSYWSCREETNNWISFTFLNAVVSISACKV